MDGDDVYFSCWKQRNGFREEFVQGLRYSKRARQYCLPYERFTSPFPIEVAQEECDLSDIVGNAEIDAPF